MKLPKFEFIQPHSLQEACSILGEHDRKAAILAGGTALMVGLRYRLSKPAVVIGLKGLTALDYVGRNGSGGHEVFPGEVLGRSGQVVELFRRTQDSSTAKGKACRPGRFHVETVVAQVVGSTHGGEAGREVPELVDGEPAVVVRMRSGGQVV